MCIYINVYIYKCIYIMYIYHRAHDYPYSYKSRFSIYLIIYSDNYQNISAYIYAKTLGGIKVPQNTTIDN